LSCLEENTLFELVRDGLDNVARRAVVDHAEACDSCRRLIAAAVELESPAAPRRRARVAPHTDGSMLAGKYRLVRLLGAGGMGAVHEAINTWTGRRVAVKVLHEPLAADPLAVRRFTVEAQSAGRIAHPNVVEILDLDEDRETGARFLVQELLTGMTLRRRLLEVGRLDVRQAARLLAPAVAGLAEAHRAGVVHRDLKPDNIFLTGIPGCEVAKLIDFGLSKLVREADEPAWTPLLAITEHGRQLGTPFYMSPEQLRGQADIDERSDVWSMGVVLFEVVAGTRPFAGPRYHDLVLQILRDPVPRLADVAPGVSPGFSALVEHALQRDRTLRPSARDLRDALSGLRRRPEALRRPAGISYRRALPAGSDHTTDCSCCPATSTR
jgi:serine/threonine-protein kinase